MATKLTPALREEYEALYDKAIADPSRLSDVSAIYARITRPENLSQYKTAAGATGVPWYVIAIIHNLESSGRFDRHLHNGDPLSRRTRRVPAGRPTKGTPPFSWADSATDALSWRKIDSWDDWSVAGIGYQLEAYNGWGYRNKYPFVKSPYLWSFSNIYSKGKYVKDGVFDPNAVSQQCGGMVLLKQIAESDKEVKRALGFKAPAPVPEEEPTKSSPLPEEGESDWSKNAPAFPDRYLQKGLVKDKDVKLVQARLAEVGCDPGATDGDFGRVTELAVKLFQARSSDLEDVPLEIDGVVGPKTWGALFGPYSLRAKDPEFPTPPVTDSLTQAMLQIAAEEVGVLEVPPGSNRGPRVEQYQKSVGQHAVGKAWCMSFVHWCFEQAAKQAGQTSLMPRSAGVVYTWGRAKGLPSPVRAVPAKDAKKEVSLVKPGAVFFISTGGGKGHTGIVVANVNGQLETIEGNTNNGGSREGIGVFRRTKRDVQQINLGFAYFS